MEIGLSLGSNLGDRLQNLSRAKSRIIAQRGFSFVAQSPVYETEPVDVSPADYKLNFLNAVIIVETTLLMPALILRLRMIEHELGRKPGHQLNAPRLIDIDIIYAGDVRINQNGIVVPHPRWSGRRFVVQPLNDVRPDLVVAGQNSTVAEILRGLSDEHGVSLVAQEW